jgi:hypothetical protein
MDELYPEVHEDLYELQLHAPHSQKSGDRKIVSLLKRPPVSCKESETGRKLLHTWDVWWRNTIWAKDPINKPPRWNSISRTGDVWNHFWEAAEARSGHPYVYCLNCGSLLQHPSVKGIGTKHLLNHLDSRSCKTTESPVHELPVYSPLRKLKPSAGPVYSPQALENELVRVLVDNNWSFRTVERPSFQRFLRFLRPDAQIITRYRFRQMFLNQFSLAKTSTLHDIGITTKLSIALDAWSAANHLSFLAVNGYYINDDWQLKEVLLDFVPLRGSHTGDSMATEVLQILRETGTTRKLLAITCDNASNNNTMTRTIQYKLSEENVIWSSKENTIPCLAHVVNLVVQDIIQHLKLSASTEFENGETLQRRHVDEINTQMSVPNSLRKVSQLSHIFITS